MRHGFLLIDKPVGPTSHDVVAAVRRGLHESAVGHIGTLDPAASGLLVLAVGAKALKVIEFFMGLSKEYEADVRFGAVSTTYDGQGQIEAVERRPGVQEPDEESILRMIRERFTGKIRQAPPAHSAVHIDGERAYDKARRGEVVSMPERDVTIEACTIESFSYPSLTLRVRCGSGTYIRSLAHDLGDSLRCGAYLAGLRRTLIGGWDVATAVRPELVRWSDVQPLKDVLATLPSVTLSPEQWEDVRHGRDVACALATEYAIAWHDDLPVAVLSATERGAHPRKVL